MADNLDDGEFWLPPQFLTDEDDDDTSFCNNLTAQNYAVSRSLFFSSSSSETESDEEDHLAELTRRVALELDLNNNNNSAKPKVTNKKKKKEKKKNKLSTLSTLSSS